MSSLPYKLPEISTSSGPLGVFGEPCEQKDLTIVKDKYGRSWRIVNINGQNPDATQIEAANKIARTILGPALSQYKDKESEASPHHSKVTSGSDSDSMTITMDFNAESKILTANIVERKKDSAAEINIPNINIEDNFAESLKANFDTLVSKVTQVALPTIATGSSPVPVDPAIDPRALVVSEAEPKPGLHRSVDASKNAPAHIRVAHERDGITYGSEDVYGYPAVQLMIDSANESLKHLRSKPVKTQIDTDSIAYYENQIKNAIAWREQYSGEQTIKTAEAELNTLIDKYPATAGRIKPLIEEIKIAKAKLKTLINPKDPQIIKGLNDKIKTAEVELKTLIRQKDASRIKELNEQIETAKEWAKGHGGWLTSNAWRDFIVDCGDYGHAVDQFIPAPVNMRHHAFLDERELPVNGVMRLAVITDVRNGWFNLQDLQRLKAGKDLISRYTPPKYASNFLQFVKREESHKIDGADISVNTDSVRDRSYKIICGEMIKRLKVLDDSDLSSQLKQFQSLNKSSKSNDYITNLRVIINTKLNEELEKGKKAGKSKIGSSKVLRLQSALYGLDQLFKTLDPAELDRVIAERQRFLGDQMLQLIAGQVDKNPKLLNGDSFKLAHVGLLNPHSDKLDSTGWDHNEGGEIADMAAIFKDFDGKEIIFDQNVTKPCLLNGEIHLPLQQGKSHGTRLTLNTFYSNCSPQTCQDNSGIQKEVNEKTLEKWTKGNKLDYDVYDVMKKLIKAPTSDYIFAVDLADKLVKSGFAVSMGCQSAKDRTGAAVGLLMQRFLEDSYKAKLPEEERDKFKSPFTSGILRSGSPAVEIVKQNTGDDTLKVDPNVPDIGKWSFTHQLFRSGFEHQVASKVAKKTDLVFRHISKATSEQFPRKPLTLAKTPLSAQLISRSRRLAIVEEVKEKAAG